MLKLFNRWGHRRFRDLLSQYIDNRLDESQASALEAHLGTCSSCREEMQSLNATVGLLRSLPTAIPRRSFALTAQPRMSTSPVPSYLWGMRAATAMASIALVVLVTGDIFGTFSRETTPLSESSSGVTDDIESDTDAFAASESADSSAPSMESGATEAGTAELPARSALPDTDGGAEETFPVTALETTLGMLLVVLVLATVFASRRLKRRDHIT